MEEIGEKIGEKIGVALTNGNQTKDKTPNNVRLLKHQIIIIKNDNPVDKFLSAHLNREILVESYELLSFVGERKPKSLILIFEVEQH